MQFPHFAYFMGMIYDSTPELENQSIDRESHAHEM